ncbi:hypothetical protein KQX54_002057 [Cotesia glomerata]|uniref:Uncharacterized protein n=1 Tax=Cotesia glomerata TaxID=32391 RepID=A0AAV7IP14_COTGL|nr:hypothetical protein KQX54_002057 [Cotesia glomerata]
MVHVTLNVFALLGSIGVILGPAILPQKFPTDAKYPFLVTNHPIYEIVYFDQAYAGILCSSITAIDCQLAMLLWYSVARLEILGLEMKKIDCNKQLYKCIRKHQFLLRFIGEVIRAGKYIVATTVIMTILAVILGGVHIIGNQPTVVKLQFVVVVGGLSMLLYVTAWPSEMLGTMVSVHQCKNVLTFLY